MAEKPEKFETQPHLMAIHDALGAPDVITVAVDQFVIPLYGERPSPKMIESVKTIGLIEPVIAYRGVDHRLVVIDGRRRLLAAKEAGIRQVQTVVYRNPGTFGYHTMLLLLNEQRSPNPVVEFESIRDLQGQGFSLSQIAALTGMSIGTVKRRCRFSNLTEALYNHGKLGGLSAGILEAASKLPKADQERLADKAIAGEKVGHTDIRGLRETERSEAIGMLPPEVFAPEAAADPFAEVRQAIASLRRASEALAGEDVTMFSEALRTSAFNLEHLLADEAAARKRRMDKEDTTRVETMSHEAEPVADAAPAKRGRRAKRKVDIDAAIDRGGDGESGAGVPAPADGVYAAN